MRHDEPSERNYAIFCAVEFEQQTVRAVAQQHDVSPTRVQQIVEQMRSWYETTTPEWVKRIDPAVEPLVACRMYDDRLAYLSQQAMDAWRQSQGEQTVTRQTSGLLHSGGQITTTKSTFGAPRYLVIAARLAKMRVDGSMRLAKWLEGRRAQNETANPCAPDEVTTAEVPLLTDNTDSASASTAEVCNDVLMRFDAPGLSETHPLTPVRTRKERRRRQRQLQRAMGK
jgi:hypothetical protein